MVDGSPLQMLSTALVRTEVFSMECFSSELCDLPLSPPILSFAGGQGEAASDSGRWDFPLRSERRAEQARAGPGQVSGTRARGHPWVSSKVSILTPGQECWDMAKQGGLKNFYCRIGMFTSGSGLPPGSCKLQINPLHNGVADPALEQEAGQGEPIAWSNGRCPCPWQGGWN